MNGNRAKVLAATTLYRWQMSQGILGALFQALTFAGVFTLLLGPTLSELVGFGYAQTLLLLVGMVSVLFLGLGFVLDRVVKFWAAQAYVGTVRNPWLLDKLYQKEALNMVFRDIVELKTFRRLAERFDLGDDLVAIIDNSITRLEEAARNKRWTIEPGEEVYDKA